MDSFEFFTGDRTADSFQIELHDGRAKLTCIIVERWEELFSRSLTCGARNTRTITQRFGISSVEHEDLEATIKGSLGLKGIAELKSEVKGKTGRELHLEESREVVEEFEFEAPVCGQLNLQVYQLKRIFKLSYSDSRFWHAGSWTKTLTEYTNRINDLSKQVENDPACGCKRKPESGSDGFLHLIVSNNLGMLVPYRRCGNGIELPSLGLSIPSDKIDEVLFANYVFRREVFPSYLLFLAGEDGRNFTGRFALYVEKDPTEEFSEKHRHQEELAHSWKNLALQQQESLSEEHPVFTAAFYFLMGCGVSALIGVLLAPKSGKETREYLTRMAEEGRDYAQRKARELRERADALLIESQEKQTAAGKPVKAPLKTTGEVKSK